MAKARVDFEIKNMGAFQRAVLDGVADVFREAFSKSLFAIREKIAARVADAIKASPEYASLLNGTLRAEFGVIDAVPILAAAIANIQRGMQVASLGAKRVGRSVQGGIRIQILKDDYSEPLAAPGASFTSEHGYAIEWMKWLTLEGDRTIIADYRVVYGYPERSRTHTAIMVRPGEWRVPGEFSGDSSENWLTRALANIDGFIATTIEEEVRANLD